MAKKAGKIYGTERDQGRGGQMITPSGGGNNTGLSSSKNTNGSN